MIYQGLFHFPALDSISPLCHVLSCPSPLQPEQEQGALARGAAGSALDGECAVGGDGVLVGVGPDDNVLGLVGA